MVKICEIMKKYLPFIIAVLFVACDSTNDFGTPFAKGQEVTLTAAIGEQRPEMLPGKQRVSGIKEGEEIHLKWDEGDKILIKVGDQSAEFTLSGGAGTGEGTFTGIMPADGTSFSIQYPTFVPDLTEQQYVVNGFGKDLMLMSTKDEGTLDEGFVLSADYALLGLQLVGNQTLSKIVLTNPTDKKTYTLHCSNVELSNSPTLFYIVVPAGEWKDGFRVDIHANKDYPIGVLSKVDATTLSSQQATIMPTIDCSITSELADPPITFLVNRVIFKMICVRAGTFMMGATEKDTEAEADEYPRHKVRLTKDFFIAETEMTQALWQAIMSNNPSANPNNPQLPVNNITYNDCLDMIKQLNQLTGLTFRLPTEAEWEYAARGGQLSKGYKYAGSDNISEVAWYLSNEYHPVAQLKPNELGIYDMSGSVYEWCQDFYNDKTYTSTPRIDPLQVIPSTDDPSNGERCLRGGSNKDISQFSRIANRGYRPATDKDILFGLRLVLEPKVW